MNKLLMAVLVAVLTGCGNADYRIYHSSVCKHRNSCGDACINSFNNPVVSHADNDWFLQNLHQQGW